MTTREYFKEVFKHDDKCPACKGLFEWDTEDMGECKDECIPEAWVYDHNSVDDLKKELEVRNASRGI